MATTQTSRKERARVALAMLAWAYLGALARGQTAKASQLLTLYQSLFREHQDAVLSAYGAAERDRVAEMVGGIQPNGAYDARTRAALTAGLVTGWAAREMPQTIPAVLSMPEQETKLGQWFAKTLSPGVSVRSVVWPLLNAVLTTPDPNVYTMSNAELARFIEGVDFPPPGAPTPANPGPVTAGPHVPWGPEQGATLGAVEAAPMTITERVRDVPTWGLWAIGAGALFALGILVWGFKGAK